MQISHLLLFNKFLFLSNLQTQILNSKKHGIFLQETTKKQTKKKLVQR